MGKISPVSAKYIVHSNIEIDGVVERPDVIGAIFGQTEGLLGSDLELRELQRSGRIGRIEVNVDTRSGKTRGEIIIPSSLDKAETAIIAAALEVIQRIGPCNAKVGVVNIEDVRISKRNFVISRAKELLKSLIDSVLPDSQELADEVAYSVRIMEVQPYGRDRLPSGPTIDESDDIIVVEGRADVLNLIKHGIKNVIAMNGTSVPQTIIELSKKKEVTVFVDGDRGGELILKEIFAVADVDYVTKAPDGKEVEEITKKEIHKALRSRIASEQAKLEMGKTVSTTEHRISHQKPAYTPKKVVITSKEKTVFRDILNDLVGTRGAYILDEKLAVLGKVPVTELVTTIKSLNTGMYAIVFDGIVDRNLIQAAEKAGINYVIGMSASIKSSSRLGIITADDF